MSPQNVFGKKAALPDWLQEKNCVNEPIARKAPGLALGVEWSVAPNIKIGVWMSEIAT